MGIETPTNFPFCNADAVLGTKFPSKMPMSMARNIQTARNRSKSPRPLNADAGVSLAGRLAGRHCCFSTSCGALFGEISVVSISSLFPTSIFFRCERRCSVPVSRSVGSKPRVHARNIKGSARRFFLADQSDEQGDTLYWLHATSLSINRPPELFSLRPQNIHRQYGCEIVAQFEGIAWNLRP